MANTYYKLLSKKIDDVRKNDIIDELQNDLRNSAMKLSDNNIFDFINRSVVNSANEDLDINTLLKYYLVNQIIKETEAIKKEEVKEQRYIDTNNANIKFDKEENVYTRNDKRLNSQEKIIEVNEDGGYVTNETRCNSSITIQRIYSADDNIMSVQLFYSNNDVIRDKNIVIKLLGLKKEVAEKFKYSGYSGESSDIITSLLNKFSPLQETGYYMDNSCNFFSWNDTSCSFVKRNINLQSSPLLTDYLFKENDIVVRKEYTGRK